MKLIIGNKSVSSWSMRPWVCMKHFSIPFDEVLVKLDLPGTTQEILRYSPTGKVPALDDAGFWVWESVAIMEYLHEKYPEKKMYPVDLQARARARSLVMEMHAGFSKMRDILSFNARKQHKNFDFSGAADDIARVKAIWTQCLQESKGPFLFGEFTIADAMFVPVVGRFQTYGVPVEGVVKDYYDAILGLPAVKAWYHEASIEDFVAANHL
jgi:glutathione S-transferase